MNASDQQTDTSRKPDEIVVFWTLRGSKCAECHDEIGKGEFLRLEREQPYCLECADVDRLEFLPSGDAALTRRARKYSTLWAVVVRFSRSRGRYERQGLLVEAAALERHEAREEVAGDVAAVLRRWADTPRNG